MNNNWILQHEDFNGTPIMVVDALDRDVLIGDEIEAEHTGQWGIVVGVIRNYNGGAECFKVWRSVPGCFDYIQAGAVTMRERCGSADWSLGRIGYTWIDDNGDDGYYYNSATGDVIRW